MFQRCEIQACTCHGWPGARTDCVPGVASHAARLVEPGGGFEAGQASEDTAFALLNGLYWLTLNLAEAQPLALVIDDLQWADAPSLRWLAYLARRITDVRVCVLAAMRPVEEEDPLLAELLVDPVTTVVRPNALGVPSVAELVRAELGAEADEPFCLACHRATGGNPPLLRELLRTLASDHMLRPRGDLAGLVLSGRPRPRINRCGGGLARPFGLPGTDSPYRRRWW